MIVMVLVVIPTAFVMGREGASVTLLFLALTIGEIAFVLSWVNLSMSKTHKQRLGRLLLVAVIPPTGMGVLNLSKILLSSSETLTSQQSQMSSHYVESGALSVDEIFSYGCTEVPSSKLDGYISSKCGEFIDMSKLSIEFAKLSNPN